MTAQPSEPRPTYRWAPDDVRQRLADYTVEDVLALPDHAPRVEIRDGVLIVIPSPTSGHQQIGSLLWLWFRQNAPAEFRAVQAVGVLVNATNTLEPDVVLLRTPVSASSHFFTPEKVVIVVEVVSPGTKRRDRFEKPGDYAAAGIAHYWRIEQDPVHIYAYELNGSGSYELIADSDSELVLSRPFEITLPIGAVTP
jgi:Uma2 family endonuclease